MQLQISGADLLLQAVISGAGDGKFYRLSPDKENPTLPYIIYIYIYKLYLYLVLFPTAYHAS